MWEFLLFTVPHHQCYESYGHFPCLEHALLLRLLLSLCKRFRLLIFNAYKGIQKLQMIFYPVFHGSRNGGEDVNKEVS